ncbi:MAG: MFS transporter [Bacillota bacterium]|nr:MFS transporter [Bacillota bacterium]
MYKNLFKNRNFTLLTAGGFISTIGDYLYNIGITIYLYNMTKSVSSVALMWLSRAVLRIPFLYLSGVISDNYNRKKIIIFTNLISAVIALLFIYTDTNKLWLIYLLAFLLQSLNDIDVNSETAILPELVSKEELSWSNSVFSFLQSTSVFLSPAIGGILYKLYGADVLFIINSLSFLISGILFAYIKYDYLKTDGFIKKDRIIKSSVEGCKIFIKYRDVKTVFIIMSVFAVIGRFYETYKVAVSDLLLNMKPEGIIYFDYALAIGGLTVPAAVKLLHNHNPVKIFAVSAIISSTLFTLFGYSHNIVLTFIFLIILGAADNINETYSHTIIQNSIPNEYLGRVFSFYKILLTMFAIIGLVISAPLYNIIGTGNSFLSVLIIMIIICAFQSKYWINEKFSARSVSK